MLQSSTNHPHQSCIDLSRFNIGEEIQTPSGFRLRIDVINNLLGSLGATVTCRGSTKYEVGTELDFLPTKLKGNQVWIERGPKHDASRYLIYLFSPTGKGLTPLHSYSD